MVQDTSPRKSDLDSFVQSSDKAFDLSVQYDTKRIFKNMAGKVTLSGSADDRPNHSKKN